MRKSSRILAATMVLLPGVAVHSEFPAPPSLFTSAASGATDAADSAQDAAPALPVENPAATQNAPSDWAPPDVPQLGPTDSEPVMTDGTSNLPSLEVKPAVDSSATDAAADAALGPRVDLAGPGTPKWKVIVYVSQTTKYDDNIYISHSDKKSDVSFSISPGFAAGWGDFRSALLQHSTGYTDAYQHTRESITDPVDGDYVYVDYQANASHYLTHDSVDAVDQDAGINAQWDFTRTLVGVSARVQTLSGPEIDLGMRTRRTIFSLDANARYTVSDKTSLDLDANGTISDYSTQLNSSDWHAQLFLDYQLFPKTLIGVGAEAGLRELQTAPDQYYEQALARASYDVTDRLSVHANGGLEFDEASGGSTRLNPVFGLGATYNIGDQDILSLDATRATASSAITSGETVENTTVNLEFRHRIYSNFSMGLSLGYQHADYFNNSLSTQVRTDNYIYARPSIAYDFAEWSQIELSYEYHRDVSDQTLNDFAENIASLQLNFVF